MSRLTDRQLAELPPVERRAAESQRNLNDRSHSIRSNITARERRLGREIVEGLSDSGPDLPPPTLRREEPRGSLPSARGYAERAYQAGSGGGGTAGLASPLIEGSQSGSALARTYHPPKQLQSSDGLFVWEIAPVASIQFRDANGALAEFRLAIPSEPDP